MNRPFSLWYLVSALLLGLLSQAFSLPPEHSQEIRPASKSIDNAQYVAANRILMFVTNHGNFGRDLGGVFGYDYGTFYPFSGIAEINDGTNITSPLYAAGLWMAGIDTATGENLVTASEYTSEYTPGPMAGGTYQTDRPEFRVYKLYHDSLAANPNQDYLDWPFDQGAPVAPGGTPALSAHQTTWSVCNDADPSRHTSHLAGTAPMGIELQQTTFAFESDSHPLGDIVFLRFKAINKGGRTLKGFYFSLWADPDLGGAADDLVGCDTLEDLFYCYNATNNDTKYGTRPPAIGFKLLEGPIVPSTGDTARVDGRLRPGYRNLGLFSFVKYTNGTDPTSSVQTYCFMKGLEGNNGCAAHYAGGKVTRYWHSGDPIVYAGDLDSGPGDRRMMGSIGPFTFRPGDTQRVLFAMVVAQVSDRLSSLSAMRYYSDWAEDVATDVDEEESAALPPSFEVRQNYPNPFNPSTTISYSLPQRADVDISVFNLLGQKVVTLVNRNQSAGDYTAEWNGDDAAGRPVASGIYFYRVRAGSETQTRKMMLLK